MLQVPEACFVGQNRQNSNRTGELDMAETKNKIEDYKLVIANNPESLASAVISHLQQGWELSGSPFQGNDPDAKSQPFYQAMVKPKKGKIDALLGD
jgi:hypothetical protein